jgi:CheY-like chemotaxis protein
LARKILLADDSVTAQNMGRKILADAGYEVIAVNNGSAALKKVTEIKPDLVVLDVYMPGYSGLEVCQRLKESPETGRIPVLLTVGKLEPFKPEEAQRVRAEAFIVKPFEASELLSALSKLEDKVVPRSEGSRPGRFARAIAAVEESGRTGRGDDNGWKNRISFPHKKTEDEEKEDNRVEEQPSTYNRVNRDLRTVVETPAGNAEEKKRESTGREAKTVDVQALAPAGMSAPALPGGVTQEEVAAITAAAAQIQQASATIGEEKRAQEAASEPASVADLDTVGFEPPTREIEVNAAQATSEVKVRAEEIPAAKSAPKEMETRETEPQDVPVTMAATAESVAGSSSGAPRWTAVAVALEGEEAGISLEQEMQRAFAAVEAGPAISSSHQESAPLAMPATAAIFAPESPVLPSAAQTEVPNVEPAPQTEPVASAPDYAVSSEEKTEKKEDREAAPQSVSQSEATTVTPVAAAPPAAIEVPFSPNEIEYVRPSASASAPVEPVAEAYGWTQLRDPGAQPAAEAPAQQPTPDESTPSAAEAGPLAALSSAAEFQSSQPPAPVEFAPSAGSFVAGEQSGESSADANLGPVSQPQSESETVKTRAAAWANWRQIRDGKSEAAQTGEDNSSELANAGANAAAVAAGAERVMQANAQPEEQPSDVASIVDSVLADLRPKLMKEISRKMAEKK